MEVHGLGPQSPNWACLISVRIQPMKNLLATVRCYPCKPQDVSAYNSKATSLAYNRTSARGARLGSDAHPHLTPAAGGGSGARGTRPAGWATERPHDASSKLDTVLCSAASSNPDAATPNVFSSPFYYGNEVEFSIDSCFSRFSK